MSKIMLVAGAAVLGLAAPAGAHSYVAAYEGTAIEQPARVYAIIGPDAYASEVAVTRAYHHRRYWKPGDLWPRSRGFWDTSAPGCPLERC